MKTLGMLAIAGACCLFSAATSQAADHGQVPAGLLSQMGLSSMQPMSDVQGMDIRGKGKSVTVQTNTVIIANIGGCQKNNICPAAFIQVNIGSARIGGFPN